MDAANTMAELNQRFEIPGIAKVVEGNGGLLKVSVTSPDAAGEMYLQGAHVTSWKPASAEEALFVSAQSKWESGVARTSRNCSDWTHLGSRRLSTLLGHRTHAA